MMFNNGFVAGVCGGTPCDKQDKEMKTLVNKANPQIRITAPEIARIPLPTGDNIIVKQWPLNAVVFFEDDWTLVEEGQQMPDSTQLIAEWEKEKAVLEQKDFRGDAERMAYNAFLDGFVKGLGYEGTK